MRDLNRRLRSPGPVPLACTAFLTFLSLALLTLLAPIANATVNNCPNALAREQNRSLNLPDCRAYEMISPLVKNGGDIRGIDEISNGGVLESSSDGGKVTYPSLASFETEGREPVGAAVGSQYLSSRNSEHWSTNNITFPQNSPSSVQAEGSPYRAFSSDLSAGLMRAPLQTPRVGGGPEGYKNYYRTELPEGSTQALLTAGNTIPISAETFELVPVDATADLKQIVLESPSALTPGSTPGQPQKAENLYEWGNGAFQAVNVPLNPTAPGETDPAAKFAGAMSSDGARVFWESSVEPPEHAGEEGQHHLLVREGLGTASPRTVQLDTSIGGHGQLLGASADGNRAFFIRNTAGLPSDLYEYDLESETVRDLTPLGPAGEADVEGVLGVSNDGSYVYFVAGGKLAPGATTLAGCRNGPQCNLYVWHSGVIGFITVLLHEDNNTTPEEGIPAARDWGSERTSRVSPDGRRLVFMSQGQVTSYENTGPTCVPELTGGGERVIGYTPGSCQEIYIYDADSAHTTCISCNPTGAPPVGPSQIPGTTDFAHFHGFYYSRVLSDDGKRVFFDSNDALVPTDTNGTQDVYEWEADGSGTCTLAGGCVALVSGGASSENSSFVDASVSGGDVFFLTRQQLVGGDTDQNVDVYDAREDGGYSHVVEPTCAGTGCQGLPAATPIFAVPPTVTFEGAGNFAAARTTSGGIKRKPLTKAQKLARALKSCAKRPHKVRAACRKAARKRYGGPK